MSSLSSSCSDSNISFEEYILINNQSTQKQYTLIVDNKNDSMYWSQQSKNNSSTQLIQLINENVILRAKIDMLTRKFGHLTTNKMNNNIN